MISDRLPPALLTAARRLLYNTGRRRFPDMEPRRWSNRVLAEMAPQFEGDVLNVSGWLDEDRRGGHYRQYFRNARSYAITNYWGSSKPNDGIAGSVFLDLNQPLPDTLVRSCDVAFSHTVLEHVADAEMAMRNLAALTRDIVILVVPFMQDEHFSEGLYGDFQRFTPHGVDRLMTINGLTCLTLQYNENPWYPIYILAIGSYHPDRWRGKFPPRGGSDSRAGRSVFNAPGMIW